MASYEKATLIRSLCFRDKSYPAVPAMQTHLQFLNGMFKTKLSGEKTQQNLEKEEILINV